MTQLEPKIWVAEVAGATLGFEQRKFLLTPLAPFLTCTVILDPLIRCEAGEVTAVRQREHVGRAINALQHGNRSRTTGKIPKLPLSERFRLISDVLIARTAKREGVTLVTDNVSDFWKIRTFCNVKSISGRDYFYPR